MISGAFFGLGRSVGSFVGGSIVDAAGMRIAWASLAGVAAALGCIYSVIVGIGLNRKRMKRKQGEDVREQI